ncbi:Ni/Fe-hydrogenase cytochrome b subunit [Candidatus Parabeggiatoa sp. HSG14]|uniref:Ni/Fe-hydrogenase cytochrome b subunit n=1 Tax=Candidatus Parabeggiatoa sp. HSG14 TaxID=3055593 RepID=UPI0025A7A116|nr:Ni/Fe-hydrogenase cytochrome b subunit [Thiotrichales bacterium HSG14]
MSVHQPLGGKLLTTPFIILSFFALIGGVLMLERFIFGLGAVSNLNNGYAWGIWIAIDVVIGTAFGCGGFVMAILIYIFNKGEYHPLIRPAVMASLFGYTLGGTAVMFDLGRYWQIYNVFLPWYGQLNSVMFEVALCVTGYIIVLWIEFTPVFLERLGIVGLRKKLEKFLFIIVAIGVLLPTMHQSSLGTLMVSMGFKLYPLWNTTLLPVIFLITAIIMGYAIVTFEALLSSAGFQRPYDTTILNKISGITWILLLVYLVIRFTDLIMREQLGLVLVGDLNSIMFLLENLFFVIPVVILASRAKRNSPYFLFISAISMLLAASLLRINTYLIGFNPGGGWSYFPSIAEIMVTVGIFSFEIMLYLIFVKTLPVLHRVEA